jgi:hypothetical protein
MKMLIVITTYWQILKDIVLFESQKAKINTLILLKTES